MIKLQSKNLTFEPFFSMETRAVQQTYYMYVLNQAGQHIQQCSTLNTKTLWLC